jgi:hypothetical protein
VHVSEVLDIVMSGTPMDGVTSSLAVAPPRNIQQIPPGNMLDAMLHDRGKRVERRTGIALKGMDARCALTSEERNRPL